MGPTLINNLPAHVLLVHVVVVLVPLTALALVICAAWPAGARRLGLALPVLALVTLASVPLTSHAGEWLERHVDSDPLVRAHARLGDGLLPWALGLFVLAAALWWVVRRRATAEAEPRGAAVAVTAPLRATAIVLSLIVGAGAVVQTYRIGDSGAKAAWHDGYSATATSHDKG
ncbi:DUF2231 domain-containing protein [Peterkaempfera griseoplana]|uniref:DUF2231 domain-containing protein n=1 Tax=Peterkaempfera griseoplana TaxID=66896 RepID=UPI0006E164F2|nr:DUF2231 domain-containing protein [Peterkaempfera griseoplana]